MRYSRFIPLALLASSSALLPLTGCANGNGNSSSTPTAATAASVPGPQTNPAAALPAPAPPAGVTAVVDDYKNELAAGTPGVAVLGQFNKLWTPGSAYNNGTVLNSAVLSANVAYTATIDAARTPAQEVAAYFDDRRNQSYSIIDGLGPLTNTYMVGADSLTTIPMAFDANTLADTEYDDSGTGNASGSFTSPLASVVALVNNLRSFSTTPAKNAYNYPRPFRLAANSTVQLTGANQTIAGYDVTGNPPTTTPSTRTWPVYTSPVVVAPSLVFVRSTTASSDGAFPSGHTVASLLASYAIAYAIPERFQEMLARASELGNNRIVAGMHDPLDVMGGRMSATAWAAAILYNNDMFNTSSPVITKQQAYSDTHNYIYAQTGTNINTLYAYAHQSNTNVDRFADWATNRANVLAHMTYGFAPINPTNVAPLVPKGAEVLLETRQPYLTSDQRRWEIYTTEIPSGYPLLDDPEGWGRVNIFAAADGMAALNGNVFITMDATQGGFNAVDLWRNDISGSGELFMGGTGRLRLSGNNSFSGGVQVNGGTIEADSASSLGSGNVILNGGNLVVNAAEPVTITGAFNEPVTSNLELDLGPNNQGTLTINGLAVFNGTLKVVLQPGFTPVAGTTYNLISTNSAYFGNFSSVSVSGTSLPYTTSFGSTGLQLKF
jgi:autotransporter-associated beta strand protein